MRSNAPPRFMLDASTTRASDALAGATPYLRLFALARGGTALAKGALAAHRLLAGGDSDPVLPGRIATARFFAENIASQRRRHSNSKSRAARARSMPARVSLANDDRRCPNVRI